jgi:hypothetical protein
MQVEQLPPNKPNFLLILILFCVSILVIFLLAWLFLHFNSNHLGLRHKTSSPHAQLIHPVSPSATQLG